MLNWMFKVEQVSQPPTCRSIQSQFNKHYLK